MLVLDDLMDEGGREKRLLDLFTKHSHHRNITVLYLCQDLFPLGPYAKAVSCSAHYRSRILGIAQGYELCCVRRFQPRSKVLCRYFVVPQNTPLAI